MYAYSSVASSVHDPSDFIDTSLRFDEDDSFIVRLIENFWE